MAVFYAEYLENPVHYLPLAMTSVAKAFTGMRMGRFLFWKGGLQQGTALLSPVFPYQILVIFLSCVERYYTFLLKKKFNDTQNAQNVFCGKQLHVRKSQF